MPSELTIEGGEPGGTHSWSRVEIVSYEEAFKRELVEFHAAISEERPPHTDGIDGLHDVALCHSIARVHMTGEPALAPSQLANAVRDMSGDEMAVANAPCSYGAFEITVGVDPNVPPGLTLLDEVSEAGYRGIDLGPIGYLGNADELPARLRDRGLALAGGYFQIEFNDPTRLGDELVQLDLPARRV